MACREGYATTSQKAAMIRNGSPELKCRPPAGEGAGTLAAYGEQANPPKGGVQYRPLFRL